MATARLRQGVRQDWLARAILSGFIAATAMLFTFVFAYGASLVLGDAQADASQPMGLLRQWLFALSHNRLIDLAGPNLYAAIALHLATGTGLALVYGYFAEPRLSGPAWQRGLLFAVGPWLLSLVLFLPLLGGGLFGLALGAGPMPVLGNAVLHVVYGLTLGVMYGPFGDLATSASLETPQGVDISAMRASERAAATGILVGAGLGAGASILAALVLDLPQLESLALNPLLFVVSSALLGAAFGGLVGSLVGLPSDTARRK